MKSINKLAFAALIALILVFAACSSPAGAGLGDGGPRVVVDPYHVDFSPTNHIAALGQPIDVHYEIRWEPGSPVEYYDYRHPAIYEEHLDGNEITIDVFHTEKDGIEIEPVFIGTHSMQVWSLQRRIERIEETIPGNSGYRAPGSLTGRIDLDLWVNEKIQNNLTIDSPIYLSPASYEGQEDSYTITFEGDGSLFTIVGGNLEVQNLEFVGHQGNTAPLVTIGAQGTFDMVGGIISGNENRSSTGNGGGVYIANGGKFYMRSEAKVTGNRAAKGGGVYVASDGKFNYGRVFDNQVFSNDPADYPDIFEELP
jgi:hypothetical protein